jgi:hypothetical protein
VVYYGGGAELPIDGLLARICQDIDSQNTVLAIPLNMQTFAPDKSLTTLIRWDDLKPYGPSTVSRECFFFSGASKGGNVQAGLGFHNFCLPELAILCRNPLKFCVASAGHRTFDERSNVCGRPPTMHVG